MVLNHQGYLGSTVRYRIAENFRWCKFSHTWPKSPQNELLYVLISHARATRPRSCSSPMACNTAWRYRSRFMSLYSFCFDRTTDKESLGRPLKDLALYSCLYHKSRSSPRVARSKFTQKISMVQISVVSISACRTFMRNMGKLAPCENFPLYGIWLCFLSLL